MKRKRTFFCIWTYWMTFLLAVMPSCIYDEEPAATDADIVPLNMGITIRVPGNDPSARGANDKTDEGTALENAIDVKNGDIRIYLYKNGKDTNEKADFNASTYLGEVSIFDTQENKQGDYTLLGRINATSENISEMKTKGFRIVVMANLAKWHTSIDSETKGYPTLTERSTIQTSYSLFYGNGKSAYNDNDYGYCVTKDKLIPMWGIHTYEGIRLEPDKMLLLTDPIKMLRAFAKIEVIDETEGSDLQLTEVSLKGHHTKFYIQPAASGYTGGNTNADFTGCNIPTNEMDTALKFAEEETSTEKKKFILYVPEMEANDKGSTITVTFTGTDNTTTTSEFPISNKTENTPILRNHIYRYTIKSIQAEVTPKLTYEVIDWSKQNIDIGYK